MLFNLCTQERLIERQAAPHHTATQPTLAIAHLSCARPSSRLRAHLSPAKTSFIPVGFRSFQKGTPACLVSNGTRWTAGQWLDSSAQVEVPVSLSVAWDLWADRERVNRWMPWIHSIKVLKDRPEFSEWLLKYNAFGQDFEFKWTAKNLQPIHHQKIHWRSIDGLPNRGTVRFYPRSPSSVGIQLTISFEVPEVLLPLAASVSPLVESILQKDLDRFAVFAKDYSLKASAK